MVQIALLTWISARSSITIGSFAKVVVDLAEVAIGFSHQSPSPPPTATAFSE
jgi:hypothetical protein